MRVGISIAGAVVAFVAACGGTSAQPALRTGSQDTAKVVDAFPAALAAAKNHPPRTTWPRGLDDARPTAITCARHYPEELAGRASAFEAVVTGVQVSAGQEPETPGDHRVVLRVVTGEVFAGASSGSVEMRTWDFMLPPRPTDVIGAHILAATGPTMDLMGCGFTRPYSDRDAALWRAAFER